MTLRDTQEAHGALLTAGAIMIGLGLLVAVFPNGLWLGAGLAILGAALALTTIALAWKDWQRPAAPVDRAAPRDPDRFWNAEERLGALIGASAGTGIAALIASVLQPEDERWLIVGISVAVLVPAAAARLTVWRRSRDRAHPVRGEESA